MIHVKEKNREMSVIRISESTILNRRDATKPNLKGSEGESHVDILRKEHSRQREQQVPKVKICHPCEKNSKKSRLK